MARDYRVSSRTEEEIAGYAKRVRQYIGQDGMLPIDVLAIIHLFQQRPLPHKGKLTVKIFDREGTEPDAKVTFEPLTLHVDEEIWRYASMGDPFSRFVLAHEIGHMVLHDKSAQAYAGKEDQFAIYGSDFHSAEWQAHTFAGHLLAPDDQAKACMDARELAAAANIETRRAQVQLDSLNRRKLWKRIDFFGESCSECANFTLRRIGLSLHCATCNTVKPLAS